MWESFSDVAWYEGCGVRDAAVVGVEERVFEAEGMVHVQVSVTEGGVLGKD